MTGREQEPFAYSPELQPGGSAAQPSGGSAQPAEAFRASPVQPHYAAPLASRDHVAAGFLALLLGVFGVHKFYLGCNAQGFTLFALTVIGGLFTFGIATGVVWIISAIEAIAYLSKSQSEFEQIYVYGKREWF